MIHLRGCTKLAVLANVHYPVFQKNSRYGYICCTRSFTKRGKSGDFINVFPSVISVLDTLVQILHRM